MKSLVAITTILGRQVTNQVEVFFIDESILTPTEGLNLYRHLRRQESDEDTDPTTILVMENGNIVSQWEYGHTFNMAGWMSPFGE